MSWAREPAATAVDAFADVKAPADTPAADERAPQSAVNGFQLIAFPDDEVLLSLRREREERARLESEALLVRARDELLERWNELQAETAALVDVSAAPPAVRDRLHAVVSAAADAILSFDASGQVLTCNPATERLFEAPASRIVGSPLGQWLNGWTAPASAPEEERPQVLESPARSANGREFVVEVAVRVVRTDDGDLGAAVLRDITERKHYEAELQRLNSSLRAQVEETRHALQQLHETQAQLVMTAKLASLGGLVAGIAHEINTPLGIAVTAASHLAERTADFGAAVDGGALKRSQLAAYTQTCSQSAQIILGNLERAAQLVQSFKLVAVDQSVEDSRVIVFADYLHEIVTNLQPRLRAGRVVVSLDCDPSLKLETVPGAWSQIVTNLVLNAVTHAFPDDREGQLRMVVRRLGERMELQVIDNGVGIAAEVLPKIFDPFFTTRRGEGGSGLGLHVTFNLVHQTLGGSLRAESRPREGTRFVIDCPAKWVNA